MSWVKINPIFRVVGAISFGELEIIGGRNLIHNILLREVNIKSKEWRIHSLQKTYRWTLCNPINPVKNAAMLES